MHWTGGGWRATGPYKLWGSAGLAICAMGIRNISHMCVHGIAIIVARLCAGEPGAGPLLAVNLVYGFEHSPGGPVHLEAGSETKGVCVLEGGRGGAGATSPHTTHAASPAYLTCLPKSY